MKKITFLTCGWTIDKDYGVWKWIYDVEIGNPSINKIIEKFDINSEIEIVEAIRKDSLDMNDFDRKLIKDKLEKIENNRIIITHWTDTMIDTWKFIQNIDNKVIIIVGAARPWSMNNSDAELNIWYALWILNILADTDKYWVYLAMNWEYFNLNNVEKWEDWIFRKIK
jgi:L-asparaginase